MRGQLGAQSGLNRTDWFNVLSRPSPAGALMTQDEMEAKTATLDGQIAAFELLQEAQKKHWAQCAKFAMAVVIPLALLTMGSAVLSIISHKTDPITPVFGTAMTLTLFGGLAFQRAAAAMQRSSI